MSISFFKNQNIFQLDTKKSTYLIKLIDDGYIGHLYYGKRLNEFDVSYLARLSEYPFTPSKNKRDEVSFLDSRFFEYPCHGIGDFRESCLKVKTEEGNTSVSLKYVSHNIFSGKLKIPNLPSTFDLENKSINLEINCIDEVLNLEVVLSYSVFEDTDTIVRSVKITNRSRKSLYITKALSVCLDMDNEDFDFITLNGSWARERHIERRALAYGKQGVASNRGISSHQANPFMAVTDKNATYVQGKVYGFSFIYSGNFFAQVERTQFDSLRAVMGINPEDFAWKLKRNETFYTPEVAMVFSSEGLNGMSKCFHDLFRNHLINPKWTDTKRPVLINNWEATYFDFNTQKLLDIAKEASKLGIELLVMDDGWFGHRSDDNSSLGDWTVNEKKIVGGLSYLVEKVNKLGMKFGMWFEPEMVSLNSDLYKAHPEWAIAIHGREAKLARHQYVLDFTNDEAVNYVYKQIYKVLKSANIEYVKWDMNRPLTDIGSFTLKKNHMGEFYHRYMLGVYKLQERLLKDFPDLLLENCSSGGGRYDPGMLYYSPQIWCSDDTDAIERLAIQEGTALVYPLSTIGSHVSVCPNHVLGRNTLFETRGFVALTGTFGYELDVTKLSADDKEEIGKQIARFNKYNNLIRTGDYYRLASFSDNQEYDAWMVVSKSKSEALVTYIQVLNKPNQYSRKLYLQGLDEQTRYQVFFEGNNSKSDNNIFNNTSFLGSSLMNAGIVVQKSFGDFQGKLIYLITD